MAQLKKIQDLRNLNPTVLDKIKSVVFGTTDITFYDDSKVYSKKELILFKDPITGLYKALMSKEDNVTGEFDIDKWEEISVVAGGIGGGGGNSGIALSDTEPVDENIKLWFKDLNDGTIEVYIRDDESGSFDQIFVTTTASNVLDSDGNSLQEHIEAKNPHGTDKEDIGLGNVENYAIADQTEAEAGTASNKYMTPQRTSQAIAALSPVKSVAGKTGAVTLVKGDVGLGNVENYGIASKTEAEEGTANNKYMTPERTSQAIAVQAQAIANEVENSSKEYADLLMEQKIIEIPSRSGKDENGIFTIVEYYRPNNTLARKTELSGGSSPNYTTRTITFYAEDGMTVTKTVTRTLIYDEDGDFLREE
jgi:hypothetical protein